jgi:hypothetical protein
VRPGALRVIVPAKTVDETGEKASEETVEKE